MNRRHLLLPQGLALLCWAGMAEAQETLTLVEPLGTATGERSLLDDVGTYAIPDVAPDEPKPADSTDPFRISFVAIFDHTNFWQDSASIGQVGEQANKWEVRAARLSVLGTFDFAIPVSYQVSGEYKGFDGDPETDWQMTDISLTFGLGERTKLTLGKTKETFVYEMVGDAANLPAMERVLSPFFVSRNTGARLTYVWGADKRGTLSLGLYNDAWDIGTAASAERGVDATARLTGLAWADPADAGHYLHLGASVRHAASKGEMRFRGRPGSNVSVNYVDTGNFAADGAFLLGLEAMLALGPVSIQGEHVSAWVDAPTMGNPSFGGWYLTANWILTGDHRPYDRNVGYARRVVPKGHGGAPELVVRYADVDLEDGPVDGGSFRRTDLGLNWWATHRWKAGVAWGHVWLDRFGTTGETDTLLMRLQWVY